MFSGNRILNVVIAIFAVIGLVAVLGVAGMAAMHVRMMDGMWSSGQAMHRLQ